MDKCTHARFLNGVAYNSNSLLDQLNITFMDLAWKVTYVLFSKCVCTLGTHKINTVKAMLHHFNTFS